jgi:hypothetical protein
MRFLALVAIGVAASVTRIAGASGAVDAVAEAPTIYAPVLHVGWRVDQTDGANLCTPLSGDRCGPGQSSLRSGGFSFPVSVAADPPDHVLYVSDLSPGRVQAFYPAGRLQPLVRGVLRGLRAPAALATDPVTGDLYVRYSAQGHASIEKFTPAGAPLWLAGRGVDRRTGANLCRASTEAALRARCRMGTAATAGAAVPGAFALAIQPGDLLAVGGRQRLLYVADEHRVQELRASGGWCRELLLVSLSAAPTSAVSALAVDPNGDLYLVYESPHPPGEGAYEVVRRFDPAGVQIGELVVASRLARAELHIDGIAIDRSGRLAVIGVEVGDGSHRRFGLIYEAWDGRLIGEFPPPPDNDGLTFGPADELYVAAPDDQEVVEYAPLSPSEQLTGPFPLLTPRWLTLLHLTA